MKTFNMCIPVDGVLSMRICAENAKQAIQILIDKKDSLEKHPMGTLNLKIEDALIVEANPKIIN